MAAPKLRFKEFDNQWDKIKINDQAQTVTSGSRDWAQYYSESGDKFIRMTNLVRDRIYLDLSDLKFVQLPKDSNEGKRTSLKFGDILISITAELGKLGWIPEGLGTAYINQHTALVRMKDSVDSKFIAYSLSTEKYNNKLNSLNDSGAKAGLNLGTIRNFELIVPPKEEQTKIASFLSAVDEKISQLTQKHELLSQYKQGMMQKLFSQQIRFKADDGCEFGEWEETTLDNFLTESLVKGNKGDEARKLTVKLWGKGVIPKNEVFQGSENTQYYRRSAGQLIYGKLDFLNCAFGIIPQHLDGFESTIDAPAFNIDQSVANPYFLLNRFFQKDFYKKNGEEADGSRKAKRINQSVFLAMTIQLPCIQEQTKIANFLSAIDQKIEVVAQQIEQAKTWKKGLLQQMFVYGEL